MGGSEVRPGGRVLVAHVPYEHRGGEDVHVELLADAYRRIGMEPVFYPENRGSAAHSLSEATASLFPGARVPADFLALWKREKPSFIHLHNAFPRLGPAFFRWVIAESVPLVMTVHNHRFFCANGLALRDGKICKDCFGSKVAWRPLAHNCNGDSKKSAYHALALTELRSGSLYERAVRKFIAPSPYIASELVRFGIEPGKVVQFFNPVEFDPELGGTDAGDRGADDRDEYDVLFASRLSPEKGIRPLIAIFREHLPDLKLAIAGDGPERGWVESQAGGGISYLGPVPRDEVSRLIGRSRIGVLPSIWNENLPTFLLECFIRGRRCVVSDQESIRWFSGDGFFGILGPVDRPEDFARVVRDALARAAPAESEVRALRKRFGMEAFCENLRGLSEELEG